MRSFAMLMFVAVLAGCAGPGYQTAENNDFMQASYAAADKLLASQVPISANDPLLVATLVNIDSLNESSRFGRLISEQIASRLTQRGFNVVEMKLRNDVYIREGAGELLLSRDVRTLSRNYNAQVVVVGNYAAAESCIYVTLKAVTPVDNRVISAVNYQVPLTQNNKALLSPARGY